jgi:hypothetical protein
VCLERESNMQVHEISQARLLIAIGASLERLKLGHSIEAQQILEEVEDLIKRPVREVKLQVPPLGMNAIDLSPGGWNPAGDDDVPF